MKTIIQYRLGRPSEVLAAASAVALASPPVGKALVRVKYSPVHPGDLLSVEGSPAFGKPAVIAESGRVPGIEGTGVIEAFAGGVDEIGGLRVGQRVAFFPVGGAWSEMLHVPTDVMVALPADIPDEIAANFLVNVITARLVVRRLHSLSPDNTLRDLKVVQTGAGSAVGTLITTLLLEAGAIPLRLVRSEASKARLNERRPGALTIATDSEDWKDQLQASLGDKAGRTAVDAVGGDLLGEIMQLLESGSTVINYGALAGQYSDIRSLVPSNISLHGLSIMSWFSLQKEQRDEDVQAALRLARNKPQLFNIAAILSPEDIKTAIAKVAESGKNGSVLIQFS